MTYMKKLAYGVFVLTVGIFLASGAFAAEQVPTAFKTPPTTIDTGLELVGIVQEVTNWFFVAFLLLAVVFVIMAAFQFL